VKKADIFESEKYSFTNKNTGLPQLTGIFKPNKLS